MPHVNGLEILRAIRDDVELQHLPVLILTAATDEKTKVEALELGATDFLQKPIKPTELVAARAKRPDRQGPSRSSGPILGPLGSRSAAAHGGADAVAARK